MSKKINIVFSKGETFIESFIADSYTLGGLIFCIWFSEGRGIWEIVTVSIFCCFLYSIVNRHSEKSKKFNNKEDLKKWVDSI